MFIARRYGVVLQISTAVLALAYGDTAMAQQPAAAPREPNAAAAAQSLVGVDPAKTMQFVFQDAPVSTILASMSEDFGFVVISTTLPTQRVSVHLKKEVGAGEAIRTLNEILEPLGYVALVSNTGADPYTGAGGSTILRVVTMAVGIKSQIPVEKGADPDDIPVTDELRTQIIPVDTVTAVGLLNELRPLINGGADMTADPVSNSIVITDTAARIHRIVEIIHAIDTTKKASPAYYYRQLQNANASDAAQLINAMFAPQTPAAGPTGAGTVTVTSGAATSGPVAARGGGGGTVMTNRVYAKADTRTNMVILTGPDDQALAAWDMLTRIDAIPSEDLNTSIVLLKRLNYANAQQITPELNQIFGNGAAATTANTSTGSGLTMNRANNSGVGGGSGMGAAGGTRGGAGATRGGVGRSGT